MAEESLIASPLARTHHSFHTFNSGSSATGIQSGRQLECRVCEESFSLGGDKVPRLLFCGHTLCHSCLLRLPLTTPSDNALDASSTASTTSGLAGLICCPFDRQPTPIDSNGVWGLKKNFALLEVLERCNGTSQEHEGGHQPLLSPDLLHRQPGGFGLNSGSGPLSVPCDEDESHLAVLYCTVCASHLCHACSERSHATRTLHTHRRIPIADKPREKPRCPAHPSHTVEFVCLEPSCCSTSALMCFICKDYKHTKHKHALLESEAESVRLELGAVTLNVKRTALQLTSTLRKLEQIAHQLEDPPAPAGAEVEVVGGTESVHAHTSSHSSASLSAAMFQPSVEEPHAIPTSSMSVPLLQSSASPSPSTGAVSGQAASLIVGSTASVLTASQYSGPAAVSSLQQPPTQVSAARVSVREHFSLQRQQLLQQESVAMGALEAHVRERLCSIRQQQEDLSSLISQMVGLVLESERCLQQDDGRVLVGGRNLTAKLQLLQQQQPQLEAIEHGLGTVEDNIPITFTKDNRIHIGAVLEMRVVTLGLDGAGKTSILFRLQQNSCQPTIPTIGFNVETLHYKNFKFTIWDVGGQPKLRPLWRHYYYNTQAVVFVVDSSNPDRLEEAAAELTKLMMERELRDVPLLLYANKQNVAGALTPSDVSLALGAGKLCSGRPWHVVGCDASSGDGLTDGLDWLTRQLGPLTT
ncbi:Small GTP-binding protein domain [Trinorchestia longiramus]|nr:Small GTP-binding protein domain [Trinorchestia longiramus]